MFVTCSAFLRGTGGVLVRYGCGEMGVLGLLCSPSAKKLMELGAEWEEHRRPLIAEQRQLVESRSQRKGRCRLKVEEMKAMRGKMKTMADEIRQKEARFRLLAQEYVRLH